MQFKSKQVKNSFQLVQLKFRHFFYFLLSDYPNSYNPEEFTFTFRTIFCVVFYLFNFNLISLKNWTYSTDCLALANNAHF